MKRTLLLILFIVTCGAAAHAADANINYDESKVPGYELPDVLTTEAGEKVTDVETWRNVRRPEILELFREHVFGRAPGRPAEMNFRVVSEAPALDGAAMLRLVDVCFSEKPGGSCMRLEIYLPAGAAGPVPVFVGVHLIYPETGSPMPGYPLKEKIDAFWKYAYKKSGDEKPPKPIGRLPGRKLPGYIMKRGYAYANITPESFAPDDPVTFAGGVIGEFTDMENRPADAWGAIGAWAWGISRAIDYFETDPDIDHTRIVSIGHSRRGKTSLWAGAQDQRIDIIISNNSGCTGAAISRRKFGENVMAINDRFPHWFCLNYRKYNGREETLPLDQHMLVALAAPRPVYVASAADDLWADPKGEFLGALHAEPVYKLFGQPGLGVTEMPAVNDPVGNTIGYHVRAGKHALTDYDWLRYLDFADRRLD